METRFDTLRDVESDVWANTLGKRLPEVKAEKVGETLTDVKGASLVYTPAATLEDIEAKAVGKTMGYVEAKRSCYQTWCPRQLRTQ